ncbi:MAG: endopeptidase La [Lentisphaeria bacterium]|nr:endopeptidase La [Lentisphaeria bacterium]
MDISTISVAGLGAVLPSALFYDLEGTVVYPYSLTPVTVEGEYNNAVLREAMKKDRSFAIFQTLPEPEELEQLPFETEISSFEIDGVKRFSVGVLVRVLKELNLPDGSSRIVVRGIKRIVFKEFVPANSNEENAPLRVRYSVLDDALGADRDPELLGYKKSIQSAFAELVSMSPGIPEELQMGVANSPSTLRLADTVAEGIALSICEKKVLLGITSVKKRCELITAWLNRELEALRLSIKIQAEVQHNLGESQREFYLREQLRTIKAELGEDTRNPDIIELDRKFQALDLPEEVSHVIQKEMGRLEMIQQASPEYNISYTYINWLLDIPWGVYTEDRLDCVAAAEILDEDHFGLDDVKKRILEFLSVLQLKKDDPDRKAPILCLVGPPGVGKTSLGQSIAKAMDRKFIRVSLGGVRDEAEIRGHRKTYVGAMPGRIMQNLKRAGSSNPVFMLDEVDKLSRDNHGDPAAALLEVLDPAQNKSFNDNYVEIGYDLSHVFFIATANMLDSIPGPLLDRMEIIRIPGYTSIEKREIAKRYLVPRQIRENGLKPAKVKFNPGALDELITFYTMESGVRELERVIAQVCRRIARKLVTGEYSFDEVVRVSAKMVRELLGPRKYLMDSAVECREPGYAVGMAWTAAGGTILPIEITAVPGGKGNLKLTGSLGKVMQESAETAFSLVRSVASEWNVDAAYFNNNDFHIHVPDGATPKDGPSAGVTMTMALLSLVSGKCLKSYLSMTGEVTLHGRVTAIGGLREKTVSALRAGIKEVIVPEENRKDYDELPEQVREKLVFHFVSDFREAVQAAFPEK